MIKKKEIKEFLDCGSRKNYSHMLIVCDQFDYENYPVYVSKDEDINAYITHYDNEQNMSKVMEVYNYGCSLEEQLNESRSWNIGTTKLLLGIEQDDFIQKAIDFAIKKHNGQLRKFENNTDYVIHCFESTKILLHYRPITRKTKIAGMILHDTIEDTNTTVDELTNEFDFEVASLVNELTTNKAMKNVLGKPVYLAYKMCEMTNDALDMKLADRTQNVSKLEDTPCNFREKIVTQTNYILNYVINHRELDEVQTDMTNAILMKTKSLSKINFF